MLTNNYDKELYWLLGVAVVFVLALLAVVFAKFINGFSRELRYVNSEIRRTDGSERRYWIKKRRRLWLSIIPFVKY